MSSLDPHAMHLAVRNDLSEIGRIAPLVEAYCAERGLDPEIAFAINLSLDEILTNTISYGYDDAAEHGIEIEIAAADGQVTVTVRDDARAFDPTAAETPDLDADIDERPIGGLGIHLVRTLMDAVAYRRSGGRNHLTLTKTIRR
jgi:serine/threonine-protein kinase RsbW/sigma-B regulation protein RsbU (phosphoserine phosphatase)